MDENYDDYDFVPTSNSSLASLFDSSGELSDNASLIYTAPKQPKRVQTYSENKIEQKRSAESKIICALVATVWKWFDSKYESLGKLGVAIIGVDVYNSYELIIYKTKTNVIVQIRINPNFEITIKNDNFLTFYDNSKQNWLIKFNTDRELTAVTEIVEKYGGKILKNFREAQETTENSSKQQQQQQSPSLIQNNKIEENRADILTRIAKLGQSILPNQDNIKTTIIQETTEDDSTSRTDHDVASTLSNDDRINQSLTPSQNNINITTSIQTRQSLHNSLPTTATAPFIMNSSSSGITYDPISLLFTENHTSNNEIRLNLNQITDKLNQVLQIVGNDNKLNNNRDTTEELLKSKIKVLQLKIENLNREIERNANKYCELQQKYNNELKQTNEESGNLNKDSITDTKKDLFVGKIKEAMSDMYDNIRSNFVEANQDNSSDVQINAIAQNIKQTTRKIVQQYQDIHN